MSRETPNSLLRPEDSETIHGKYGVFIRDRGTTEKCFNSANDNNNMFILTEIMWNVTKKVQGDKNMC